MDLISITFSIRRLQYPQIGLPLVETIQWIVMRAEVVRRRALPTNGAVEHPTECDTINRSGNGRRTQ